MNLIESTKLMNKKSKRLNLMLNRPLTQQLKNIQLKEILFNKNTIKIKKHSKIFNHH